MKHTKEQLRVMSVLELNRTLAKTLGKYLGDVGPWIPDGVKMKDGMFYTEFDLMKWDDIMPLANEHGISLVHCPLAATTNVDDYFCTNTETFNRRGGIYYSADVEHLDKPQRAIASCLIMVLEGKL